MPPQSHTHKESVTDKISQWIILVVLFLLPLFFIPSPIVSFQFAKTFLIYIGVIVSLCVWVIARLKDGKIWFPRHYVFAALGAVAIPPVISALLSPVRTVSFFGQGFETGTAIFLVTMVVLALITSYFFTSKKLSAYAYLAFLASFVILFLFHFLRLFAGPEFLSFGIFTGATSSLVGTWNDFGIYVGAIALFSFITLELLILPRWARIVVTAALILSFFFLSIINFSMIWYVLGVFALIFFIYNFSFRKNRGASDKERRSLPLVSLIVFIISFVFIIARGNVYSTLSVFNMSFLNRLSISNVEVRPSWTSTFMVAKQALSKDPVFGVGPNRFTNEWLTSKPADINMTNFWGVDFAFGVGFIPTLVVTTGLLGLLTWLVFFIFFIQVGFKALFAKISNPFDHYLTTSSFIIAFYLWIFVISSVPSAAIIALTFFFTGLFLASLIGNNLVGVKEFNFTRDPRTSFISVLLFVIILLGLLTTTYAILKRFASSLYFNTALAAANARGDIASAEANIIKANQLSESDVYERTITELNLVKINVLTSQQNVSQDILQSQFATFLRTALAAADAAVAFDPTNYQNFLSRARVYESVVPLNTAEAYERAVADYAKAKDISPKNPALYLLMARLEVAHKNNTKAKEYIAEALKLKNNYTDAIFLLSQIQVAEGDIKSAIQSVQSAALVSPNDPGIFFQLGLLRYNDKNYATAVDAFEQAVNLAPSYSNAKYFLGLAYDKLNRSKEAIRQFEDIVTLNPDNQEVVFILENLRAGRDPFANVKPPLDSQPEKRPQPPVEEDTTADTAR